MLVTWIGWLVPSVAKSILFVDYTLVLNFCLSLHDLRGCSATVFHIAKDPWHCTLHTKHLATILCSARRTLSRDDASWGALALHFIGTSDCLFLSSPDCCIAGRPRDICMFITACVILSEFMHAISAASSSVNRVLQSEFFRITYAIFEQRVSFSVGRIFNFFKLNPLVGFLTRRRSLQSVHSLFKTSWE